MSTKAGIALLGMLLVASASAAQQIELTPFVGYQLGGWFTDWYDYDGHDADVDASETYGLLLDIPINHHAQIELLYSRQETEIDSSRHHRSADARGLDIEHFQIGFLWQWRPGEEVRPFVVGSLGVASFSPEGEHGETAFAASVGGGVKLLPREHFGVRLEGRIYSAAIDDEELFGRSTWHHYWDTGTFVQFEFKAGLIFLF